MSAGPGSAPAAGGLAATRDGVARIQAALGAMGLDGWLFYEFRGQNWIAADLLGVEGTTRRAFVLVPREGPPTALVHAIECSAWLHWEHGKRRYAGWQELEEELAGLLAGGGRVAMEVSPGDAVPTVDLVPAGVLEMVMAAGIEPVSSGDLVSRFFSAWTEEQLAEHRTAAEVVAQVAKDAFQHAADAIRRGAPTTEGALSDWIRAELADRGVTVDVDTHVAVGAKAAD
ncbi:MAG: aminopeptidase P family protein, partial [Gemmatimonadetes bacterium]|nr:aminopeptidase P family protein [Gemmatimonadota bacterium]